MKISLIIPVYNEAPFLKRCLDSVKNQSKAFDEVIVIDDASSDNSLEIINEYADAFQIYHLSKNRGVSYTRNFGIDKASSEYITFLDSDDELLINTCELMHEAINLFNDDMIQFNHIRYYEKINKKVVKNPNGDGCFNIVDFMQCNSWWGVWNKVFKKEAIKHPFDCTLSYGEDGLFILNMLLDRCTIRTISQCTTIHHFENKNSLTHTKTERESKTEVMYYRKILADLAIEAETPEVLKSILVLIQELETKYEKNNRKRLLRS